jgi:transposase InsO family protein
MPDRDQPESSPAYRWASRGLGILAAGSFLGLQLFVLKVLLHLRVPGLLLALAAALTLLATFYCLYRVHRALPAEPLLTPAERRRFRVWLPLTGAVAALEFWLLLRERLPAGPGVPK